LPLEAIGIHPYFRARDSRHPCGERPRNAQHVDNVEAAICYAETLRVPEDLRIFAQGRTLYESQSHATICFVASWRRAWAKYRDIDSAPYKPCRKLFRKSFKSAIARRNTSRSKNGQLDQTLLLSGFDVSDFTSRID
jgi:hypothetical protein